MVTYFGFPDRGYDAVAQPIIGYLNQQFDVMLQEAHNQLLATG